LSSGWTLQRLRNGERARNDSSLKHHSFDIVDSTNEVAKRLLADGTITQPAYITAREQTAGKGSRGRTWLSPRDAGIYLSVVDFPSDDTPPDLTLFTLAAGVACAETLTQQTGIDVRLKPINDLYVDGRKLGGILTEAIHENRRLRSVITGIGINVRNLARPVPDRTVEPVALQSLLSAYDLAHLDLAALASALTESVLRWNVQIWSGLPDRVREAWHRHKLHPEG